ncbi:TetR/AcrR family transcriptional regulator [uncultured Massilia sp.]|uniref:TetR/AcrR family transcriptional regulator n=1 Tax=uncultured Massilia sp. TaxID=169973 RepID=UPI0025F7E98C|nr:TetR/AcrR family transcriptional regulator [uncultured Massilia sp.]
MTALPDHDPDAGGARARKRNATRARIAETGLQLFLRDGYEATTLDDIAAAAGISRRSFFSYFKSKDDLVLAWQAAAWQEVCAALRTVSPDTAPLDAVRRTLVAHAAQYQHEEMEALDGVMRASETLTIRKQAAYATQEAMLFDVLCEVWRQPEKRAALRIVAMVAMGAMRLAIEDWRRRPEAGSAAQALERTFDLIRAEI